MRQFTTISFGFIVLLTTLSCVHAADHGGPAFTDPEKAGVEYQLQGEYAGQMKSDGGEKIGSQVIALGDNKFRVVGYMGGLPGDGWSSGDEKHTAEGELKDGQVRFVPANSGSSAETAAVLKDGAITVTRDGETIAEMKKVARKSPTLGAKPPEGAAVLFDGGNVDAWEKGQLVEKDLLGATGCTTKKKFGDHHMHIEFRTPFMPTARGQGRGNSGVYIQGRYECQVLDSFGLEGEENECGGIYSIAKPAVNMCFPPLAWQTYDIDFTAAKFDEQGKKTKNARVTIKHNGVNIYDDMELPHGTPGWHEEGPGPDALFLQNHGNPVAFRNIWVVEK